MAQHSNEQPITFSFQPPPEEEGTHNYLGAYDHPGTCIDCQQANCPHVDRCLRFEGGSFCMCVTQGLHGSQTSGSSDVASQMYDIFYPPLLGIEIPNNENPHHYAPTQEQDFYPLVPSSGTSSDGSHISTPPSPNLDVQANDWSHVSQYMTAMRARSTDSRSSAHGDEASNGPESANGSPQELFASDASFHSYGSHSPHSPHSPLLPDFTTLNINTDATGGYSLPSPDLLSPVNFPLVRSNSFGAGRRHSRSVSSQLPSELPPSPGRGRGLERTRSVPSTRPNSRRPSPYSPRRQQFENGFEAGPSNPIHLAGSSSESVEDAVVKEVVQTEKTREAAAKRRKNPANWCCIHCDSTFTTKFKRDRHVQAHTGQKPFMCSFMSCHKTFSSQSDKVRHEKTSRMHERDRDQMDQMNLESSQFS